MEKVLCLLWSLLSQSQDYEESRPHVHVRREEFVVDSTPLGRSRPRVRSPGRTPRLSLPGSLLGGSPPPRPSR